jgi:hypothetical protein
VSSRTGSLAAIETPDGEVQAGRETHPQQVGEQQQRAHAGHAVHGPHGEEQRGPEHDDVEKGRTRRSAPEEDQWPERVEEQLQLEACRATCSGRLMILLK